VTALDTLAGSQWAGAVSPAGVLAQIAEAAIELLAMDGYGLVKRFEVQTCVL
jgi:hypothetical protein